MKFTTEITTRNWNNGWVDVNSRMPKDGDSCYILYKATLISYDVKARKSKHIEKTNGMGEADYVNGEWNSIHSDYGCKRCWTQQSNDFLDDYYFYPSLGHNFYGDDATYEIIDSDIFKTDPNRLYMLSRTSYPRKRGFANHDSMHSVDFEILAWCSIPDEPINPFEKNEDDAEQGGENDNECRH